MYRRLPTWFPNLRLQMLPLSPEQTHALSDTGWLREVAFKCEPRTTKLEIKAFLEAVHGMKVERVNTINYQGKKKQRVDWSGKAYHYRKSDWKKAYVLFEPPLEIKQQWLEKREEQQRQRLNELKQAALQRQRLPHFPQAAAVALAQDAAAAVAQSAAADRAAVLAERQRRMEAAKQWKQQRKQQKQKQQQGAAAVSGSNKGGSGSRSGGSSRSVAVAACVIEACLVAK